MINRSTIEQHLSWIRAICNSIKQVPYQMERGDLLGYAVMGFLDAESKYDSSRGIRFKTYAEHRIRGAIRDAIRQWCGNGRQSRRPIMESYGDTPDTLFPVQIHCPQQIIKPSIANLNKLINAQFIVNAWSKLFRGGQRSSMYNGSLL